MLVAGAVARTVGRLLSRSCWKRLPTGVVESPAMSATTERRAWIFGTTAPALVFLLVIAYLPIAYAVMLSFFKKTAFNPAMKWVGLANYRYILEEPELWNAFWRSVVFTVGAVGLQLVWGLVSALLLNRAFRGLNFVRSLFVLPYLLPSIAVALIFQWLLSQEHGFVNQVLMQTGVVTRPINFFGGLATAMWAGIGMAGWQSGSFPTPRHPARRRTLKPQLSEARPGSAAGAPPAVRRGTPAHPRCTPRPV